MAATTVYRGGSGLVAKPAEVRIDPSTGMVQPTHGVSVFDQPDNLDRFGGAHEVTNVPASLQIVQRGRNPHHFEIVPAAPMTFDEYQQALDEIILVPT